MSEIIVQKFGGTSVGSAERIGQVANIIQNTHKDNQVIVVVSAISPEIKAKGTTSLLLKAAKQAEKGEEFEDSIKTITETHTTIISKALKSEQLQEETLSFINTELDRVSNFLKAISVIQELTYLSIDNIISAGERLSAYVLTQCLNDRGLTAKFVDLGDLVTWEAESVDSNFFLNIQKALTKKCSIEEGKIPVLTGFFGPIPGGMLEKVGRGYTDFTAALVTAGYGNQKVKELQVWKEVDGICTADPRRVPEAKLLTEISALEASELTHFGSEVLHPFTMERVTSVNIPIRVKNTFNPDNCGTCVVTTPPTHNSPVTAITAKKGITIITLTSNRMFNTFGFLASTFIILRNHGIVVDLVSTSEISISFSVENVDLSKVLNELKELGNISIEENQAILAVVGQNIKGSTNTASTLLSTLASQGIETSMISKGASQVNISCVISESKIDQALPEVHKAFF